MLEHQTEQSELAGRIDKTVIRVMIVDAHDIERAGILRLLSDEVDFDVVAEAASVDESIALAVATAPNLALIALGSTRLDGLAAIRAVTAIRGQTVIVALSDDEQSSQLMAALEAGAGGFVLKDTDRLELLALLRQAAATGSAIPPDLARQLVVRMAMQARSSQSMPDPLTARELDVLRLIARGQTNREIAHELIVAVGTVKVHIEHILTKLSASGRTAAAVRALELGIIQANDDSDV
jgi:DNA-binding NarL/FixJ family response regulator